MGGGVWVDRGGNVTKLETPQKQRKKHGQHHSHSKLKGGINMTRRLVENVDSGTGRGGRKTDRFFGPLYPAPCRLYPHDIKLQGHVRG